VDRCWVGVVAVLDASELKTWWLHAGARTYTQRFDADAAHITAQNILAHFA
jgi:hypothetical protein